MDEYKPKMLYEAIRFATDCHRGQTRKGSLLPYISHPMAVASLVRKFASGEPHLEMLMTCAMLHDVVEDCQVGLDDIRSAFGPSVATIVDELTSNPELVKSMGKTRYLQEKLIKMSDAALLLKLCDRLDNVSDAPTRDYLDSTRLILQHVSQARALTESQRQVAEAIYQVIDGNE